MAVFGKLINQLEIAAPLSGNELIPIWQGEHTKRISILNLGFIKSINNIVPNNSGEILLTAESVSAIPFSYYETILQNINNVNESINQTINNVTYDFGVF